RMIDDLMDAAHLQLGHELQLKPSQTDLVTLIRDGCREFGDSLEADRFRVRMDSQVDSIVGLWDRQRIERVLMNLLDNARKYSLQGGEIAVRVRKSQDEAGP